LQGGERSTLLSRSRARFRARPRRCCDGGDRYESIESIKLRHINLITMSQRNIVNSAITLIRFINSSTMQSTTNYNVSNILIPLADMTIKLWDVILKKPQHVNCEVSVSISTMSFDVRTVLLVLLTYPKILANATIDDNCRWHLHRMIYRILTSGEEAVSDSIKNIIEAQFKHNRLSYIHVNLIAENLPPEFSHLDPRAVMIANMLRQRREELLHVVERKVAKSVFLSSAPRSLSHIAIYLAIMSYYCNADNVKFSDSEKEYIRRLRKYLSKIGARDLNAIASALGIKLCNLNTSS